MLPQVNIVRAIHGDYLSFFERAGISSVLTAHGIWDELTILISKLLIDTTNKVPVVLDIGANMGTFAVPIAKYIATKGGSLYAFEPQRITFYQLCGNIFFNRIDNAYLHNIALSAENATGEMAVLDLNQAWNIGSYSFVAGKDEQKKLEKTEPCNFVKLDDFTPLRQATLIKIDVEGMEIDVLQGAAQFIARSGYPPILFESLKGQPRADFVFELLGQLGYAFSQYADEDWLAQHPNWDSEIKLYNNDGQLGYLKIR